MKFLDSVNRIQQSLDEIVDHYTWVAEIIRDIDGDYIVETDVPNVPDVHDLSFQIKDNGIDLIHDEVSFGEDFSRIWHLSYDILSLQTEEDIAKYVQSQIEKHNARRAKAIELEAERLRNRLEILEKELADD